MCEGEESDGDEDEGGVPGDQSADQVAVHCTHQYSSTVTCHTSNIAYRSDVHQFALQ